MIVYLVTIFKVLILIILEVTLWEKFNRKFYEKYFVLILIILEVTLWDIEEIEQEIYESLNPYYTGSYSMS